VVIVVDQVDDDDGEATAYGRGREASMSKTDVVVAIAN
jgi:hypothetical protein